MERDNKLRKSFDLNPDDLVLGYADVTVESAVNVAAMLPDDWKLLLHLPQHISAPLEFLKRKLSGRFAPTPPETSIEDALYAMNVLLVLTEDKGFVWDVKNAVVDCVGVSFDVNENVTATEIAGRVMKFFREGVDVTDERRCSLSWTALIG